MTPIAFTLCSNNYFSRALAWADSLRAHNSDYKVIIGLVDKRDPGVDYTNSGHNVLPVEDINIPNIEWMISHYSIVEFNTAVKPFYFDYLFRTYTTPHVLYFDPDIYVYHSLLPITRLFENSDILLTPHVNRPIPKGTFPWENHYLKFGLYNLGFAGIRAGENGSAAIEWWKERTAELCLYNLREGLYVDQLWANYFPIFFEHVTLVRHPGANVAYWNIHERAITRDGAEWCVNGEPLLFFHFSSFDPNRPDLVTKESYSNYNFSTIPGITELTNHYATELKKNHFDLYQKIPFTMIPQDPGPGSPMDTLATRIVKRERILNALSLRLVKRESLIVFVINLLKDYAEYDSLKWGVKSESINRIDLVRKQHLNLQNGRSTSILERMRTIASSVISFIR